MLNLLVRTNQDGQFLLPLSLHPFLPTPIFFTHARTLFGETLCVPWGNIFIKNIFRAPLQEHQTDEKDLPLAPRSGGGLDVQPLLPPHLFLHRPVLHLARDFGEASLQNAGPEVRNILAACSPPFKTARESGKNHLSGVVVQRPHLVLRLFFFWLWSLCESPPVVVKREPNLLTFPAGFCTELGGLEVS